MSDFAFTLSYFCFIMYSNQNSNKCEVTNMVYTFEMLEGECFWGGSAISGCDNPFNKDSDFSADYTTLAKIQTMPMFLSNKGRVIWSDNPFSVKIKNGVITITGKDVTIEVAGSTLKDAYLTAMKKHFPFDGKRLPDKFFTTAQYNTWMEFTYTPTQEGTLEYARNIVKNGFEPGILIIDEGWHKRYGEWVFDEYRFPDPKAMVDELHELGFTVMLWVVPVVTPDGLNYVQTTRPSLNVNPYASETLTRTASGSVAVTSWWNGYSAILDMRKKCDAEYLDSKLQFLMKEYGIDGFKFDGGNVHMYHPNAFINGPLRDDHDPHEMNRAWNEFGRKYEYHEYKDSYKAGGKNCIERLQDRGHRWDGDGINTLIPCSILQGLLGTPFICPDMIGGGEWSYTALAYPIDEELFVRMAQVSALCPMMQFSWAPWRALSDKYLKMVVDAAMLHKKMSGEILKLVRKSEVDGEPILRNLEYNYPGKGYEYIKDQFMLGEDILVCPVVTKGTFEREVVFPEGVWVDEDGNRYTGGTTKVVASPIEKLPWFTREK